MKKSDKNVVLEVTIANEQFFASVKMLEQRWADCNRTYGHLLPTRNHCDHCYRRFVYETPKADSVLAGYPNTPLYELPRNVVMTISDLRRIEIAQQEHRDWMDGIWKVKDQMFGKK